ncbi:ExeA family protein [Acidisphaera rubrifaciens]|uniref:ATPase AAA n=1 Tax=Acidisphaera rubrifaciens HS-AP3 TaxID=1231350 RepID=A0A0D6P8T3_9PROT|nr:AAA family ATPase [Acidisphaera rubrifaciens]GAN77269.1 ATPase AAA [Acidisphaera rubrifaciens HS-AP3]
MIALGYSDHYCLDALPFQLTPDGTRFFKSQGHRRAMTHMLYGLAQGEGIIVVTGEIGAGKTTLIEFLRGRLGDAPIRIGSVIGSAGSGADMLRFVAAAFGARAGDATGKAAMSMALLSRLRQIRADGVRCLLVVDEVQTLDPAALEELRLMTNLLHAGQPLLQIMVAGQPEFRATLARHDMEPFRQRVIACFHLGPLSAEETHAYILHRLTTAGWRGNPIWQTDASHAAFRHTQGIPRRVNRLCGRVLMRGALDHLTVITSPLVEAVADELAGDLGDRPAAPMPPAHPTSPPTPPPAAAPHPWRHRGLFRRHAR